VMFASTDYITDSEIEMRRKEEKRNKKRERKHRD